jgi:ketosteroid isomerase-like protein
VSEENVEIVREMYEAFHGGDLERALTYFDDDVVADFSIRVDSAVGRGREELREIVAGWVSTWDEYREEIDEIRDLGDRVFVAATQHGRGKGSGIELETQYGWLYAVEDGRITTITAYDSPAAALKAAGVSE